MQADVTKLPGKLQGPVQEYVGLLEALAAQRLLAVTVFGAAAETTKAGQAGMIQSIVVLDRLSLEFVRELGAQGATLGRMNIQAPLLMTPEYITASLDVFPIELLDIQQRHVNIMGQDYFAPLKFKKADVRLQLERELKRELIQIRQGVLAAGGRDQALTDIYWGASEQALQLLRAVLWMHDKAVPAAPEAIVRSAEEVAGVVLPGLQPAITGAREIDFSALQGLYESIIELANHTDDLSV
ncbi:MAG: hypothetical protein KAV82_15715 [Phycisphaerae bacterium]|nr:hypothetical protein [Phycisphaerae bacterium]